ncbi:MAG: response regulator transcription factor [Sulfurovum sp.]|nr:response regulator transcription factor [Sulfurovum sp.]
MINILMIEDDPEFAEILSEYLSQFDMKVTNYEDPFLGLSAGVEKYDLIILDLTLPGMDGLEACEELGRKYNIPIIISSARSDINDKVESLRLGADDYLPKPYDPKELYARILSLLRRYNNDSKNSEPKSDFSTRGDTIYYKGNALQLTPAEFEILTQLVEKQGIALSREQLINASTTMSDSAQKSLDVIVSKIRAKLGDSKMIQAVRGVGYKLI